MTTAALLALLLSTTVQPPTHVDDEDLRDLVVLTSGEEVRGRVTRPFGADSIVVMQGGKRREFDRADVVRTSEVRVRLADWLQLRAPGMTLDREWELVNLAEAADLHAMARVQAFRVLALEPDHEEAHAFLGHEGKPGKWKWEVDGRLVSQSKWEKAAFDEDDPLPLRTEHFDVRCEGGLLRTTEIAFDLELTYAAFMDAVGSNVDAGEVIEPMIARVHMDEDDFRPLSSVGKPYYDPGHLLGSTNTYDNAFFTFYLKGGERPEQLVDLAVQQLIYSSVLGDKLRTVPRDTTDYREAACLEVGLGDWFQRKLEGPPGFARFGAWRPDKAAARIALGRSRSFPLKQARHELVNLIQVTWGRLIQIKDENELYWAKCRTFVAFLMENGATLPEMPPDALHEGVLRLVRTIYGVPTGNSSKAWDDALVVVKLEALEGPWKQWMALLP
ncbi:MAG: hypothetical protein R3F34_16950 [Planctomycetota bacterium]